MVRVTAISNTWLIRGPARLPWAWLSRVGVYARHKPLGSFGAGVLLLMFALAVAAPLIAPYDPYAWSIGEQWGLPSLQHLMGTDQYGRDVLSRLLMGARVSLSIAFGATIVGTLIGALIGLVSGYVRGMVDMVVQRLIDVLMSFPTLVLALAVVAALGPTITGVVVALTIPMVPRAARVVRASAMATREQPFVEAAEAIGCSGWRIVRSHILPSALAPYIVVASAQVGWAIVVEASLGFLGLGVQPLTPSWGQMLDRATEAFLLNPWSAIFPGLAIAVTVFALNLSGDALRDILDPRLKGR